MYIGIAVRLVDLGRNMLSLQIKHTARIFMCAIDGVYFGHKGNGEITCSWHCMDIRKRFISYNVYNDAGIALPGVLLKVKELRYNFDLALLSSSIATRYWFFFSCESNRQLYWRWNSYCCACSKDTSAYIQLLNSCTKPLIVFVFLGLCIRSSNTCCLHLQGILKWFGRGKYVHWIARTRKLRLTNCSPH